MDILLSVHGDNDDGTRCSGHDLSGRFDAIHDRHDQVHQDKVRRQLRTALDGFGAIGRDPDHLMRGLESDGPAQGLHGHGHIVDDSDLHPCAPPINSITASSKASS